MSHIRKKEIELYILNGIRNEERIGQIQDHLEVCDSCARYFDKLKKLYTIVKNLPDASFRITNTIIHQSPNVSKKSDSIILYPMVSQKNGENHFLLAAETQSQPTYKHIQSYINDEDTTLARILYNGEKDDLKLFLVSKDIPDLDHTMIKFDCLNDIFFTDAQGRTNLLSMMKNDIIDAGINVQPLKIMFDTNDIKPLKEVNRSVPIVTLENKHNDRLICEVSNIGKKISWIFRIEAGVSDSVNTIVLRLKDKGGFLFSKVENGISRFVDLDVEKISFLHFY